MSNQIIESSKSFFLRCKRVWYVMRKPTKKEFEMISKVSALGILIIGFAGFLISVVMNTFFK